MSAVERAHADQLVEREQRAGSGGCVSVGPAQRQRRDDHVDALAGGQARVDHRAGLVDAAVDGARRCGRSSGRAAASSVKRDVDALEPAVALDVDLVGAVDHDLGDRSSSASSGSSTPRPSASSTTRRISRVRSAVESTGPSRLTMSADHALQPRAALRRPELGDLGEVDLLQQLALEVARSRRALAARRLAVRRRARRRPRRRACGPSGPCQRPSGIAASPWTLQPSPRSRAAGHDDRDVDPDLHRAAGAPGCRTRSRRACTG